MQNLLYRLQNSFSLINVIPFSVGVGMFLVGLFAPLGWDIPKELAKWLTYIGLGLAAFGAILAVWRFFTNPIEKKLRVYGIIPILNNMEKQLWQLAETEKHKNIDWKKYIETSKKVSKLMSVTVPEVATVDEARNEIEALKQELAERHFKNKKMPRSKKVIVIRSISRLLDSDGFGLGEQKRSNKSYLRLNQLVDKYYDDYKDTIDKHLNALIRSHIDFAEAGANALLVKYRTQAAIELAQIAGYSDFFSPSTQSDLEGFEEDIRDITRDIRIDIGQYIKRLSSEKRQNEQ